MKRETLSFDLPHGLIAQKIIPNPEKSRLLVLSRTDGKIQHGCFSDLIDHLEEGDLLVLNNTAVLPTRIWGIFECGGQTEVTLVNRIKHDCWESMVRPDDGIKKNTYIFFKNNKIAAKVIRKTSYNGWLLKFVIKKWHASIEDFFQNFAEVNAPFYIRRRVPLTEYQTVYARVPGSTQCPTAGLHFTKEYLVELGKKGVKTAFITLHIGGSVLPLTVKNYDDFRMYKECFSINRETKEKILHTKRIGKRVVAVGTTVMRALETAAYKNGAIEERKGWTNLTIKNGYRFKIVDAFLTNFHLPSSSHLLLTSAFCGIENVMHAYHEAIVKKYRFLDFGDAMLIS